MRENNLPTVELLCTLMKLPEQLWSGLIVGYSILSHVLGTYPVGMVVIATPPPILLRMLTIQ